MMKIILSFLRMIRSDVDWNSISLNIPHDEIDDCMHYCSDGYLRIADKIMETLKGVLGEL